VLKADKLTTSGADCVEIWEPQTPGILKGSPGLYRHWFTFYIKYILHLTDNLGSLYIQQMRSVKEIWFPSFHNDLYSANLTVRMFPRWKLSWNLQMVDYLCI